MNPNTVFGSATEDVDALTLTNLRSVRYHIARKMVQFCKAFCRGPILEMGPLGEKEVRSNPPQVQIYQPQVEGNATSHVGMPSPVQQCPELATFDEQRRCEATGYCVSRAAT